jgi:hypothetical protein
VVFTRDDGRWDGLRNQKWFINSKKWHKLQYQSNIIITKHCDYDDSLTLVFTNSYIILPQFYADLAWFCTSVIFFAQWE